MANPRPPKLVRTIIILLLVLIVVAAVASFIAWLVVRPRRLVYTIEDGSIHGFNLRGNNHLNAIFNFVLKAHNPNKRTSIYYYNADVWVTYDGTRLASLSLNPFIQPRRNSTKLDLKLVAENLPLTEAVARDLRASRSSGNVVLAVHMKAKIRVKVGKIKSRHRTLRIVCSHTLVYFSSSDGFNPTSCRKFLY